jgi:hypothetical protein
MGCGPRRVAGPRVHRGPHSGRRRELDLAAVPGHGGLPWRHRRQEGGTGPLAEGSPWAERRRGGLAAVESGARWRRSVCEMLRERRVGGHGMERWRWGGGETAGEVMNGWWRCGLTAVS